ncbi:hypothetical protein FA13DRAFT_1728644 [Coprinellus micaceus]|jgi:hypothetical protein|uniref:F-box domain-containing protein n=1 Tax=Coprinellus micaceus TaxID=71717 RepID=A0A4Y7TNM4_COPMI|nr:hypothetical protein FA13DRAFT_1728644 [Coprinellus micaceus]
MTPKPKFVEFPVELHLKFFKGLDPLDLPNLSQVSAVLVSRSQTDEMLVSINSHWKTSLP